jgi:dTDP-4-dehydrorhamnose reductase
MKRILILGSRGMAGHLVARFLSKKDKYIIGKVSRIESEDPFSYNVDVTNVEELEKVIKKFSPVVIINCLGILNKEAEDNPEKAIFINSFVPHYLAKKMALIGGRLIHISTDCVFSGRKGNYLESDLKDGEGYYAQSKALGEVNYGNNLTIRTSIIGPELKQNGIGLFHWFLKSNEVQIQGYANTLWGGVTTIQLAKAIYNSVENENINGIVHLTNGLEISKFDLLSIIKLVFNKKINVIKDFNHQKNKSLVPSKQTILLGEVPGYEQMINELKYWMEDNRDIYSHNYTF